ncbi:MAG: putative capsid protein [Cressdnaviricota sp.]|nr:MAG: putative capsid protein [Cressdnaviricota sp.]
MGRLYARKFRSIRKRKFGGRYGRKYTRGSRKARIYRTFQARRPVKPEIKYINYVSGAVSVSSNSYQQDRATPATIITGPAINQKIGNSVKIRKCHLRILLTGNQGNTQLTAYQIPSTMVRVVVWTPRLDYGNAAAHMSTIQFGEMVDFNTCTVWLDRYYTLGNAAFLGNTNITTSSGIPNQVMIKKTIPFMRKWNFSTYNATGIDPEAGVFYNIYAYQSQLIYSSWSRTFFVDA